MASSTTSPFAIDPATGRVMTREQFIEFARGRLIEQAKTNPTIKFEAVKDELMRQLVENNTGIQNDVQELQSRIAELEAKLQVEKDRFDIEQKRAQLERSFSSSSDKTAEPDKGDVTNQQSVSAESKGENIDSVTQVDSADSLQSGRGYDGQAGNVSSGQGGVALNYGTQPADITGRVNQEIPQDVRPRQLGANDVVEPGIGRNQEMVSDTQQRTASDQGTSQRLPQEPVNQNPNNNRVQDGESPQSTNKNREGEVGGSEQSELNNAELNQVDNFTKSADTTGIDKSVSSESDVTGAKNDAAGANIGDQPDVNNFDNKLPTTNYNKTSQQGELNSADTATSNSPTNQSISSLNSTQGGRGQEGNSNTQNSSRELQKAVRIGEKTAAEKNADNALRDMGRLDGQKSARFIGPQGDTIDAQRYNAGLKYKQIENPNTKYAKMIEPGGNRPSVGGLSEKFKLAQQKMQGISQAADTTGKLAQGDIGSLAKQAADQKLQEFRDQAVKKAAELAAKAAREMALKVAVAIAGNPVAQTVLVIILVVVFVVGLLFITTSGAVAAVYCKPTLGNLPVRIALDDVVDKEIKTQLQEACGVSACGVAEGGAASASGFDCKTNTVSYRVAGKQDGQPFRSSVYGGSILNTQFTPQEPNLYYALMGLRSQEYRGKTATFIGGDRDSCGPYQQRLQEIDTRSNTQIFNASEKIRDNTYMSCKALITNEKGFSFFDRLALERLKLEGAYDDVLSYDLKTDAGITSMAKRLCDSQRPDAYRRNGGCPVGSYYVQNLFYAIKSFVGANQHEASLKGCGVASSSKNFAAINNIPQESMVGLMHMVSTITTGGAIPVYAVEASGVTGVGASSPSGGDSCGTSDAGATADGGNYGGAPCQGGAGTCLTPEEAKQYTMVVTSCFYRNSGAYHGGTDYQLRKNGSLAAPVPSIVSGVVDSVDTNPSGYGINVSVKVGPNLYYNFAHLSKRLVNKGDTVTVGQIIGIQGSTGASEAPHVHFNSSTSTFHPKGGPGQKPQASYTIEAHKKFGMSVTGKTPCNGG